jgi:single-strand DNA-binding protein
MSGKATIEIVGRLARDPEMRYTADGKAVTSFSIPVQERKDGDTTWYKITAWEKAAETLNQYATKGTWLWLRGTPKIETWEDKESGETRTQFAVVVREFTFCGGGEKSESDTTPATPARQTAPRQAARNVPQRVDDSFDLPF